MAVYFLSFLILILFASYNAVLSGDLPALRERTVLLTEDSPSYGKSLHTKVERDYYSPSFVIDWEKQDIKPNFSAFQIPGRNRLYLTVTPISSFDRSTSTLAAILGGSLQAVSDESKGKRALKLITENFSVEPDWEKGKVTVCTYGCIEGEKITLDVYEITKKDDLGYRFFIEDIAISLSRYNKGLKKTAKASQSITFPVEETECSRSGLPLNLDVIPEESPEDLEEAVEEERVHHTPLTTLPKISKPSTRSKDKPVKANQFYAAKLPPIGTKSCKMTDEIIRGH